MRSPRFVVPTVFACLLVPQVAAAQPSSPEILDHFDLGPYLGAWPLSDTARIATDAAGNVYLADAVRGVPDGATVLGSDGALSTEGFNDNLLVIKVDPSLTQVIYRIAIGGAGGEGLMDMVVSDAGEVYLAGRTESPDFPKTVDLTQTSIGGIPGAFVLKVNPAGDQILFSTILGAEPIIEALAVDAAGSIYIGGHAGDTAFATTPGVLQPFPQPSPGAPDPFHPTAFLAGLSADGSTVKFATAWGQAPDEVTDLAIGPDGALYFATASGQYAAVNTAGSVELRRGQVGRESRELAFDGAGNLYVTGVDQQRTGFIKAFAPDGSQIYTRPLRLGPLGLLVTPDGHAHEFVTLSTDDGPSSPTRNTLRACAANIPPPAGAAGIVPSVLLFDGKHSVVEPNGDLRYSTYAGPVINATLSPLDGSILGIQRDVTWESPLPTIGHSIVRINPDFHAPVRTAIGCIGHGATYAVAPVSPGSLMVLYGSGLGAVEGVAYDSSGGAVPLAVDGTSVTVDGTAAPVVYAQDGQVNFFVPWATRTDGEFAEVCATRDGQSDCVQAKTAPLAPGIVQWNNQSSGLNQSLALNQDGSINSPDNPAARGELLRFYITGSGPLNGPLQDGAVADRHLALLAYTAVWFEQCIGFGIAPPSCPPNPTRNAVAEVVESGVAPGLVEGFAEVTIRIPQDYEGGVLKLRLTDPKTGEEYVTDGRVFVEP